MGVTRVDNQTIEFVEITFAGGALDRTPSCVMSIMPADSKHLKTLRKALRPGHRCGSNGQSLLLDNNILSAIEKLGKQGFLAPEQLAHIRKDFERMHRLPSPTRKRKQDKKRVKRHVALDALGL